VNVSVEDIEAAQELTPKERKRLGFLEDRIDHSIKSSFEAGEALREVRDSRLYRETHPTFEAYARARFGFERAHAYRLIDAARVAEVLSTLGTLPAAESHARELVPLLDEPEKLRETWTTAREKAAAADRPLMAVDVRDARKQLTAAPELASNDQPKPEPAPAPAGDGPEDLRFAHIEEGVQILKMLPAPGRIAWPTDEGDLEVVGEAVEWLARFAPALARAWREHRRERRRLHAV
jgi:hypothetical protein